MDMARNRRAVSKQRVFSVAAVDIMQMALLYENNGTLPAKFKRIMADWASPESRNPAVQADAISKLVSAGVLPAASDVTLKYAGFSPIERAQIAQDRVLDQGQSMLEEIAHSLEAKALRTDTKVVEDAQNPAAVGSVATPPVTPKKPDSGSRNAG
jgi:hypothetical protein